MLCKHCGRECLLARDTASNGAVQLFWWCIRCQRPADPRNPFVSKHYAETVLRVNIATLPAIERYPKPVNVCAYTGCRRTDTELHHFGPRHLFGPDADNWPQVYLCAEHHQRWHAVVTPNMCQRKGEPANG